MKIIAICPSCNIEKIIERKGLCGSCYYKQYKKEKNKEYREKNKDRIKAYKKTYQEKNKEAIKKYRKTYRKNNDTSIKKYRREYLLRQHEVTEEWLAEQKAKGCAICGAKDIKLVIDHDHKCCNKKHGCKKCVRGVLCHAHNKMLGNANDNVEILYNGIIYLNRHKALSEYNL